jgi:F420-non-reducing hydrogenase iron-sulfur subunit
MSEKERFEPKIIGFLCNWCAYAGADLAGVSRIQYPTNIRIIRVMCSGRIDPAFILEAFKDGADGVLVAGCHLPSDCHYLSGNFKALRRVTLLKNVLNDLGIEPGRLRLEWVSASEGDRFADIVKDMVEEIKKLGPNPLRKTEVSA